MAVLQIFEYTDSGVFEFDGIDDGIIIPDIGTINTPTISFWVKWDSLNTRYLGPFDNYNGNNHEFTIHDSGGGDSGNIGILYPNGTHIFHTPSKNTWYHYAVTYNRSKIKAYVDGSENLDKSVSSFTPTFNHVGIGSRQNDKNVLTNGRIDDVRIYNKALSQSEITDIYNATKP
jgi:hypothetical protein